MDIQETLRIISRGTSEIIDLESLEKKLRQSQKNKKPLRVKAGFDPTAPDIHLGHVVLLRKLRQFQNLGHEVDFLIGDFTAQIGDPTGKDQLRVKLDRKMIGKNAKTYQAQAFKVLDPKKTRVVFNSAWLDKLSPQDLLELTAHSTVAQMLARADFKKRYESGKEISLLEFIYPLLQGYDSVHLKSDVEIGGSDQRFNLLMGRQLQESRQQPPQVVIMTPLIEGTDGIQKMSKSLGNYIGINEAPAEIFGKVMSISDELMYKYAEVLTDVDLGSFRSLHPKEAKLSLAENIVEQFHGQKSALESRSNFEKTFSQREVPDNVGEFRLSAGVSLDDILLGQGLVSSKRELQRLIEQGSISFGDEIIRSRTWAPKPGVLRVGKRRFLRLVS